MPPSKRRARPPLTRPTERDSAQDDDRVIGECLRAAADGPFFAEADFEVLFGLNRETVRSFAAVWPHHPGITEELLTAVNASLHNLLALPPGQDELWPRHISVGPGQLQEIYARWRRRSGWPG